MSPWRRTALRGFNYLAGLAVSSILMAVFLAPILALSFGRVPLLGTALNMVLIPLYTLLAVPLGLAGLFLSLIHPALGTWPLSLAAQTALAGANLVAGASQWDWVSPQNNGLDPDRSGSDVRGSGGGGGSWLLPDVPAAGGLSLWRPASWP